MTKATPIHLSTACAAAVAVAALLVLATATAGPANAQQQVAVGRYRRSEVDPINLAAEINAALGRTEDANDVLSNVRATIPSRARAGTVDALSNQVDALRDITANRAFQSEVNGLAALVGIVTETADAVESIANRTMDMVPNVRTNAAAATSLATEMFVNRIEQGSLVKRVDGILPSELAGSVDSINEVYTFISSLVEGSPSIFESVEASASSFREQIPLANFVRHFGGMFYMNKQLPVMRWVQWSTYNQNNDWYFDNRNDLTGGVAPSTWGNGNGRAYEMTTDVNYLRTFYNKRVYCGWNCAPHNNEWYSYSSTNSHHGSVFIRIRNTTPNTITWNFSFYYSSYGGWEERASISHNDANTWETSANCGRCLRQQSLSLSGNRIHTIIIVVGSSNDSGNSRTMHLGFINESLRLPDGLEYVEDLDWITSL